MSAATHPFDPGLAYGHQCRQCAEVEDHPNHTRPTGDTPEATLETAFRQLEGSGPISAELAANARTALRSLLAYQPVAAADSDMIDRGQDTGGPWSAQHYPHNNNWLVSDDDLQAYDATTLASFDVEADAQRFADARNAWETTAPRPENFGGKLGFGNYCPIPFCGEHPEPGETKCNAHRQAAT